MRPAPDESCRRLIVQFGVRAVQPADGVVERRALQELGQYRGARCIVRVRRPNRRWPRDCRRSAGDCSSADAFDPRAGKSTPGAPRVAPMYLRPMAQVSTPDLGLHIPSPCEAQQRRGSAAGGGGRPPPPSVGAVQPIYRGPRARRGHERRPISRLARHDDRRGAQGRQGGGGRRRPGQPRPDGDQGHGAQGAPDRSRRPAGALRASPARPRTPSRCSSGWRRSSRRRRASCSAPRSSWPRTGAPTSTCATSRRC